MSHTHTPISAEKPNRSHGRAQEKPQKCHPITTSELRKNQQQQHKIQIKKGHTRTIRVTTAPDHDLITAKDEPQKAKHIPDIEQLRAKQEPHNINTTAKKTAKPQANKSQSGAKDKPKKSQARTNLKPNERWTNASLKATKKSTATARATGPKKSNMKAAKSNSPTASHRRTKEVSQKSHMRTE